ncbi:TonB-dependent receptor [Ulvibacter sp.]|nr:TonB-dependent receptor [Ulvibacter sp.]
MKQKLFWALCFTAGGFMYSQQNQKTVQLDSVQIDTKTMLPRKSSGKVVFKITSQDLEKKSGMSVSQIVNQVSGIEINGSRGNEGQNLGYFVRGGRNRQVVIMIDGVQMNDPSQIANDFDLRLLSSAAIESIEIIKGASSVLYGSGAATAVISITTKKTSEEPVAAVFSSSYGSNSAAENRDGALNEFTNYVGVNGTVHGFFYKLDLSNRFSDGLSAIAADEGDPKFQEDVFNRYNLNLNVGYHFSKQFKISRFFGIDNFKAGFDDFSYVDADNESESKQRRTGGTLQWKHKKATVTFNDSYTWIEREISASFPSKYDAEAYSFDAFANYEVTSEISTMVGLNGNFATFNSFSIPFGGRDFKLDPYLNLVYISKFGLNINTGLRLNMHSDYGNNVVYNINPSYNFDFKNNNLKILASYSTAYITPSLFQLYDPLYGNASLQPEENTTMEAGVEFTSANALRFSVVYFSRNETNYVDFVNVDPDLFIYQYQNTNDAFTASGIEIEASKKFAKKFTAIANYTNTQADERFALRIPEHKLNASLGYQVFVTTYLGLNYQFNSERDESFFNPLTFESENTVLSSYGLLDITGSHRLSKNVQLFASMSNILNEEFEELYRYQTRGRNFRLGFTLTF